MLHSTGVLHELVSHGLQLKVFDKDRFKYDDPLGRLHVGLDELAAINELDFNEALPTQGVVRFSVLWVPQRASDAVAISRDLPAHRPDSSRSTNSSRGSREEEEDDEAAAKSAGFEVVRPSKKVGSTSVGRVLEEVTDEAMEKEQPVFDTLLDAHATATQAAVRDLIMRMSAEKAAELAAEREKENEARVAHLQALTLTAQPHTILATFTLLTMVPCS